MAKTNLIAEIESLIQHIEIDYQKGIDYKLTYLGKEEVGNFEIISPHLKKVLRERFNFPFGVNDFLDYHKYEPKGNWFTYRISKDRNEDYLFWVIKPEWKEEYNLHLEENIEKCSVCGKLAPMKDGRMKLWDSHCEIVNHDKETNTLEFSKPLALAYLHPECAKKYFVNKEQQTSQNSIRIKKLLRNLDKICLDPMGELANAELLKQRGIERNYNSDNFQSANDNSKPSYDIHKKWLKEVHEVEIEGEKIELGDYSATSVGSLGYQEVKEALRQEIEQNPVEWEIADYLDESSWKSDGGQLIIRNKKTGRRHWKAGFYHFWDDREKKRKEWDKIEAILKGCKSSTNNQISPTDKNQLLQYFLTYHIKKITLDNGKLVVEYDNSDSQQKVNNSELEKYKSLVQKQPNHSISLNDLQKTNPKSQKPTNSPDNSKLVIGLALGAGIVFFLGIIIYFWNRKKNHPKRP